VYLMSSGRVVDEDSPTDLVNSGRLEKLFFA
jgi:hypothetical protein